MVNFINSLKEEYYSETLYCMSFDEEYYKYFLENQENPMAQLFIGILYAHGRFLEMDYNTALQWIKKSVDQNNSYAQNQMGDMYYYGYGVDKDYDQALKWYKLSAEQNNSYGQLSMGFMYEYGYGVKKNYIEAMKWFKLAADQKNCEAQLSVAYLYGTGLGVEKNLYKALKIYKNNRYRCRDATKFLNSIDKNKFTIYNEYVELKKENKRLKTYVNHLETLPGGKIYEDALKEFSELANNQKTNEKTNEKTNLTIS